MQRPGANDGALTWQDAPMEQGTSTAWHSFRLVKAGRGDPRVGAFGGHPRGIRAQDWPRCKVCNNPMCHMAQIDAGPWLDLGPFQRLTLFICHATGGRCEDWDPRKGANFAMLHRVKDDNLYDGPPTVRVYRRLSLTVSRPKDEHALMRQVKEQGLPLEQALHALRHDKLGGGAVWLHGDATPPGARSRPMRLVAQLTTDLVKFDITPEGMAYVFVDDDSPTGDACLLWQGQ
ncbi:MAG: hypothetical protein AB8H79_05305 [Myxococcota bacterium]